MHNLSAFRCGQLFIGLGGYLYVEGDGYLDEATGESMPSDGVIESQLVWSHDGKTWHHFDEERTPAIGRSKDGFDSGMIIGTAKEPVVDEEAGETHWYYTGATCTHGSNLPDRHKCIGRATWRNEGFFSLDAGEAEAVVETAVLQLPEVAGGVRLQVNADVEEGGGVRVELLGDDRAVVAGRAAVDCVPLRGDSTRHLVSWASGDGVDVGAGGRLRLRFLATRARLFSFVFTPAAPAAGL